MNVDGLEATSSQVTVVADLAVEAGIGTNGIAV
jgi:hypothetical protein